MISKYDMCIEDGCIQTIELVRELLNELEEEVLIMEG